jgi:hypothetical protein
MTCSRLALAGLLLGLLVWCLGRPVTSSSAWSERPLAQNGASSGRAEGRLLSQLQSPPGPSSQPGSSPGSNSTGSKLTADKSLDSDKPGNMSSTNPAKSSPTSTIRTASHTKPLTGSALAQAVFSSMGLAQDLQQVSSPSTTAEASSAAAMPTPVAVLQQNSQTRADASQASTAGQQVVAQDSSSSVQTAAQHDVPPVTLPAGSSSNAQTAAQQVTASTLPASSAPAPAGGCCTYCACRWTCTLSQVPMLFTAWCVTWTGLLMCRPALRT